jgi:hypothetical protein
MLMILNDLLYHPVSGKSKKYFLFLMALVPSIILFPFPASVFSNGVDPPLAWVFNFLIQGKLSLAKHIIFPHGPLAFLMYPLPIGANLWIAVLVHLMARIFLAYSILKLATRKPLAYMLLAWVACFVLLAVNDLLSTVVQVIILCYLNFFERRNVIWLIPAFFITPVALYIKAFVGIVSMIVTLSFAGIMIYRTITGLESRYRLLMFLIIPFTFLLVWLGLYGDLDGIAGYFKGMLQLAGDNSAAVAVYPSNNWWWISIALISGLVLIVGNLKNTTLVRFTILVGPALFALWKYGMAREDYQHASMMFVFILFVMLVYNGITGKFNIVNTMLSVAIVLGFYATWQTAYYYEPLLIKANGLQNLVSKAKNYQYFADTCQRATEKLTNRNKLDKGIMDLIGTQTVDIYPWDYTYIYANRLNWQPRPVIQSYASYTSYLDQLNSTHFESASAPEFIVWELRKITRDIHGGTLESIDGRYLLNDEPETLLSMLCQYEQVACQGGDFPVMVLSHRSTPLKTKKELIGKTETTWNSWIDVPAKVSGVLRAWATLDRSFLGKLNSLVYKDDATYIYYLLENGDIRMYRIVPKTVSYGLWINPLVMNPEKGTREPQVSKIMFRCSNTAMMKDKIEVSWEKVSFSQNNTPVAKIGRNPNTVDAFFGIDADSCQPEIIVSLNNLEYDALYWSVPDGSKISTSGKTRSLILSPGEYSVSFQYPLDSLIAANDTCKLIVRAGVWAKAESGAEAVYVISIEKNGEPLFWKGVDFNPFIHEQSVMNLVVNYAELDKEMLRQKGLVLKVYAWNTGKESIMLDDFSVRIEKR